jgi:hypothetical protein
MLNVFAQDIKACLGQWPLEGDKNTEPEVLKAHLSELFDKYPALRLITGDALYAQRNLAELIVEGEHDYLFQLKKNQPDVLDVAKTCLDHKKDSEADAVTRGKKGGAQRSVFFGSTWRTPTTFGNGWVLPVAASCYESTGSEKTVMELLREKQGTFSRASIPPKSRPSNC